MNNKKPRISVQDIAEILVDRLDNVEQMTKRIEKATSKELKIDAREVRQSIQELKETQNKITLENKAILKQIKELKGKTSTRLPNSIFITCIVGFLALCGVIFFFTSEIKETRYLQKENKYLKTELRKKNK